MNHSNPPDAIDYYRPRETFYMSTTPTSIPGDSQDLRLMSLEDMRDPSKLWENFKKNIEHVKQMIPGSEDPKQEAEKAKTEKDKKKEEPKKEEKKTTPKEKSALVLSFQLFFNKSHPVIGTLYSGPKDGKINPQIIAAAQAAESKIASTIGQSGVQGLIWNGKSFSTSPADVQQALSLIVKHTGKKTSFLSRRDRILALSSLLDE